MLVRVAAAIALVIAVAAPGSAIAQEPDCTPAPEGGPVAAACPEDDAFLAAIEEHLLEHGMPTISMEQAGASVVLEPPGGGPVRLDGSPHTLVGFTQQIVVLEERPGGAPWSLTASVSDFAVVGDEIACAAAPSSTDSRCIPGDNLGWNPSAVVAWPIDEPPEVIVGPALSPGAQPGLGSAQQLLCASDEVGAVATYACAAGLALLVPASASAGTYQATLTFTLV